MAFCRLSQSQASALIFIWAIEHNTNSPGKLVDLINNKDWAKVAEIADILAPDGTTGPSEDDFAYVGNMGIGLQSAYFVLLMADLKATDQGKASLQQALDTHCWDNVASQLCASMSATGIQFSGADLHEAYAPEDNAPCNGQNAIIAALGPVIAAGLVVGDFFSHSLPDFFTNDVANFFTNTIPGFFTGDFANFFKSLGSEISGGFQTIGSELESIFGHLDPTSW